MAHTVWFENSHYGKLRSRLHVVCSAQPVIHLQPVFEPTTWASDLFILFQNGIRHQVLDIFALLQQAVACIDTKQVIHSLELQKWVEELGYMIALYFLVLERVILPELNLLTPGICSVSDLRERTLPITEDLIRVHARALKLGSAARRRQKENLVSVNDDIYGSLESIWNLFSSFTMNCERYFSWEACIFVPVMEKATRSGVRDILRRCFSELLSFEEGERIFRGYSAHLPSDLREYCLHGISGNRMRKVRTMERRWAANRKYLRKRFSVLLSR